VDFVVTWLDSLSITSFGWIIFAVAAIRAGISFAPNFDMRQASELRDMGWDVALGNVWVVILKTFGITERVQYEALAFAILVLFVALTIGVVRRLQPRYAKFLFVLVFLGPMGTVMMGFGRHDVFLIFGAILFVAGGPRRPASLLLGAALIVAGNRMQSLVMAVAVLALAALPEFRRWAKPGALLGSFSVLAVLGEEFLADQSGRATQSSQFTGLIGQSLESFVLTAPLLIYAMFGVAWLIVAATVLSLPLLRSLVVLLALVVLPLVAMATTLDGTRVAVGVSAVPLLICTLWVFQRMSQGLREDQTPRVLALWVGVALLTPALSVGAGNVGTPWYYVWFSINFWTDVLQA